MKKIEELSPKDFVISIINEIVNKFPESNCKYFFDSKELIHEIYVEPFTITQSESFIDFCIEKEIIFANKYSSDLLCIGIELESELADLTFSKEGFLHNSIFLIQNEYGWLINKYLGDTINDQYLISGMTSIPWHENYINMESLKDYKISILKSEPTMFAPQSLLNTFQPLISLPIIEEGEINNSDDNSYSLAA